MLLRTALPDMADPSPGSTPSDGALEPRRGDAGRGERTPHQRGELGVASSEGRPLVPPELNLEVRSSPSSCASALPPSVAFVACSSSQKPSGDASSFTSAEDEGPSKLEEDAADTAEGPTKLEEDLLPSWPLDLRRELLRRARATEARLRLNHVPNSKVSPPVV